MRAALAATRVHSEALNPNLAIKKSFWKEVILAQSRKWQIQVSQIKKGKARGGKISYLVSLKRKLCGCGETAKVV